MNKTTIIKQFIVVILFILGIGGVYYISKLRSVPSEVLPHLQPTLRDNLRSVTPGETTVNELNSTMGDPLKVEDNVYEYQTTSDYRFHEVMVEEDVVGIVKEIVTHSDKINSNSITDKYGESQQILFNTRKYRSSFKLNVYPENGIAYIGHTSDTTVLEIWYFPPTENINEFQEKWAPEWTFEPEVVPHD